MAASSLLPGSIPKASPPLLKNNCQLQDTKSRNRQLLLYAFVKEIAYTSTLAYFAFASMKARTVRRNLFHLNARSKYLHQAYTSTLAYFAFASMKARTVRRNLFHLNARSKYLHQAYTSTLAYFAFASMKARRGGTSSPISIEKISLATCASSIETCCRIRVSGSIVVSQSCSAFISPSPL